MSAARSISLVARRELRERVRSRVFVVSMAVTVVAVVGVVLGPAIFTSGMDVRTVGVVGDVPPGLEAALADEGGQLDLGVDVRSYASVGEAEAALGAGELDAAIVDGQEVVWQAEPDSRLDAVLSGALAAAALDRRAETLGIEPDIVAQLLATPEIAARSLETVDPERESRLFAAIVAMVLLFATINMYGSFVLTGVVEEKSNRVVEVLLARLEPRHLLAGKILGIGALGLAQVLLLLGVAAVAMRLAPDGPLDMPEIGPALVGWLGLWFVLGFAFYATGYGAFGALASRMEDAQSGIGPLTLVIVASYFFAFIVVLENPDALAARIATYVPVTAPLVMPMRIASATAAWWELLLAPLVTLAWIYAGVRLAGRIYTGAILHLGARVALPDAWRAAG